MEKDASKSANTAGFTISMAEKRKRETTQERRPENFI
jgi:hypothetical protein